jgi:hypothetical protein
VRRAFHFEGAQGYGDDPLEAPGDKNRETCPAGDSAEMFQAAGSGATWHGLAGGLRLALLHFSHNLPDRSLVKRSMTTR